MVCPSYHLPSIVATEASVKNIIQLSTVLLFLTFLVSEVFSGNLSLIEKRLLELDKLNKQAVQQAGPLPKDGSVAIEAKVGPTGSLKPSPSGIIERSFEFGKKTILSIDDKHPFTVQISSSRSQKQCYRVATMLRRAGYPAFTSSIELKDTGVWHRIFVGSYTSREEAEATKTKLETDEISDGFIRSLPYAIQVGYAVNYEGLKELRDNIFSLEYLPYTSSIRDTETNQPQTRLLVGAYKEKKDTSNLLAKLRKSGFKARVVIR